MYPRGFTSRGGCARGADPPETGDRATSIEIRRPGFDSPLRRLFIGLATFPMGERGGREDDCREGSEGESGWGGHKSLRVLQLVTQYKKEIKSIETSNNSIIFFNKLIPRYHV